MRRGRTLALSIPGLLLLMLAPAPVLGFPSLEQLYRRAELRQLNLSPSGDLIASLVRKRGKHRVLVRRRGESREVLAFERASGIRHVAWIDDSHLIVSLGRGEQPTYHVVTVVPGPLGLVTDEQRVRARGRFVDLLPSRGERLLWSIADSTHTSVYVPSTRSSSISRQADSRCSR